MLSAEVLYNRPQVPQVQDYVLRVCNFKGKPGHRPKAKCSILTHGQQAMRGKECQANNTPYMLLAHESQHATLLQTQ